MNENIKLIKPAGNGAHILINKKYIGKKAHVLIIQDYKNEHNKLIKKIKTQLEIDLKFLKKLEVKE